MELISSQARDHHEEISQNHRSFGWTWNLSHNHPDRPPATDDEITASFSGDELVRSPRQLYTRAVSIKATPEQIYPWIAQLGADKGGMYSYTWIESLIQCAQTNADRIHQEWQELKPGDKVPMCPDVNAPPAYEVGKIEPNCAIVSLIRLLVRIKRRQQLEARYKDIAQRV